jgi:hypothetical protein
MSPRRPRAHSRFVPHELHGLPRIDHERGESGASASRIRSRADRGHRFRHEVDGRARDPGEDLEGSREVQLHQPWEQNEADLEASHQTHLLRWRLVGRPMPAVTSRRFWCLTKVRRAGAAPCPDVAVIAGADTAESKSGDRATQTSGDWPVSTHRRPMPIPANSRRYAPMVEHRTTQVDGLTVF